MRTAFLPAGLLLATVLPAQHLVVYSPPPAGPGFLDLAAPSPLFPGPAPPAPVYPVAPVLPPVPPGPPLMLPPGDSSLNSITGMNWYTNGLVVAAVPSPLYAPLPPIPPFPIGVIGGPLAGPVTGMALNPIAGILWLTDGAMVVGCAPIPGTPVLFPPFPSPAPMLTGLDWDGITGTLRGVTAAGVVWTFLPGGAVAMPPVPPLAPLPGVAADLAIDKSGLPGMGGPRNIFVLAGPMLIEAGSPLMIPAGVPMGVGIAFHPRPSASPPIGVCACPAFAHGYGTTVPMTAGNLGFGLTVTGLPPVQIVLYAFDFAFNPAFPVINGIGCGLGFFFGSPTLVTGAAFSTAAGTATYPLPLAVPMGFGPIYHQSATLCPATPAGFVLNPMLLLAACGT